MGRREKHHLNRRSFFSLLSLATSSSLISLAWIWEKSAKKKMAGKHIHGCISRHRNSEKEICRLNVRQRDGGCRGEGTSPFEMVFPSARGIRLEKSCFLQYVCNNFLRWCVFTYGPAGRCGRCGRNPYVRYSGRRRKSGRRNRFRLWRRQRSGAAERRC